MKLLQFALEDFCNQLKQQYKVYCIIILALAVTFASSLIIMKAMLVTSSEISQVLEQKRTYFLNMVPEYTQENGIRTYKLVEELISNNDYPEIESIDTINLVAMEDIEVEENSYLRISLEAVITGEKNDITKTENPKMIEGQWFSDDLNFEKNVIVLSKGDRDLVFPDIQTGDTLELLGNEFFVLGISLNSRSCVPFGNVGNLSNFITELNCVTFKNQLSMKQLENLQLKINEIGKVEDIVSLYDRLKIDAFLTYVFYMILIAAVMGFCIGNTTSLFRYLAIMKIYDFNIYKICGIKQKQLKMVFYIEIFGIGVIGCLLGTVFYQLLIPLQNKFYINTNLPISIVVYIILALIGILLMSVRPTIHKLAKRPPIDRTFWR